MDNPNTPTYLQHPCCAKLTGLTVLVVAPTAFIVAGVVNLLIVALGMVWVAFHAARGLMAGPVVRSTTVA